MKHAGKLWIFWGKPSRYVIIIWFNRNSVDPSLFQFMHKCRAAHRYVGIYLDKIFVELLT